MKGDSGATAVEFALILPVLLLLIFGIIEFGFVMSQMNEVRHAAREGARYAAVSRPDYNASGSVDNDDVLAVVCDSLNLPGVATVDVSLAFADTVVVNSVPDRLEYGTITVVADTNSLSGVPFIATLLPPTLTNDATFRLEQDGAWGNFALTCP